MLSGQPYMTLRSEYCWSENKSFHEETKAISQVSQRKEGGELEEFIVSAVVFRSV